MQLIRSVIFVPGNRANMLERALAFDADIVMVDLEDSVPPGEKVNAREVARDWIPRLSQNGQRVFIRVNSLDTGLTKDELAALVMPELSGISLGKVESVWDLRQADRMLSAYEEAAGVEAGQVKLIAWVESAKAVMAAQQLANASPRVIGLAFGAEDYTNDMGIQRTDEGGEVYLPRATVPIASRAGGVAALDSPYVRFQDPEGLEKDAGRARQMGYTGKFAIHPSQLDIINKTFSPMPEDVDYARQVLEVWDKAESEGRGSIALDGRMIDVPVVKRARNLLAVSDAIAARRSSL